MKQYYKCQENVELSNSSRCLAISRIRESEVILCDYDGLIVNSEKIYIDTWKALLNSEGKKVAEKIVPGKMECENYLHLKGYLVQREITLSEVSALRREQYDILLQQRKLKLLPGVKTFIRNLYRNKRFILVSNSSRQTVKNGLETHELYDKFGGYFCLREGKQPKPHPDLYIEAVSNMNIREKDAIAFEDSISGLSAAQAANILTIAITNNKSTHEWCEKNNTPYFNTMTEINTLLKEKAS